MPDLREHSKEQATEALMAEEPIRNAVSPVSICGEGADANRGTNVPRLDRTAYSPPVLLNLLQPSRSTFAKYTETNVLFLKDPHAKKKEIKTWLNQLLFTQQPHIRGGPIQGSPCLPAYGRCSCPWPRVRPKSSGLKK